MAKSLPDNPAHLRQGTPRVTHVVGCVPETAPNSFEWSS